MNVVLPFCWKDVGAMQKLLGWVIELGKCRQTAILSYDDAVPAQLVQETEALAKEAFGAVEHCIYNKPPVDGWPAACNWAWQSTVRYMWDKHRTEPWFWMEADSTPLKPGWSDILEEHHARGGKPFAGHVVHAMGHMNGVGIYPGDVMARSERAMLARAGAWDYVLKDAEEGNITPINNLIQHSWNVSKDGIIWNGEGSPVKFQCWADVERWMDFNCVIHHRCKDGSLIDRLREKRRQVMSVEHNVPQFTKISQEKLAPKPAVTKPGEIGRTEIFIVTYAKDAKWLEYCLKAIQTHGKGFAGVTVAYPKTDKAVLHPIIMANGCKAWGYDEVPGKGMIHHMAIMALADQVVIKQTKFVFHLDSDCIYFEPFTPADYFVDGKPVYLKRTYESLINEQGVVSDCHQWLGPTRAQLGEPVEWYTMCRHPTILPIEFYKPYREHIEKVHNMPFVDYMVSGKNSFPQDRMDWTAMGSWAHTHMHDRFHWIDIGVEAAPKDKQKTYWSHAGVNNWAKDEMESFLRYIPTEHELERMAQ